jgi:hypothetical protein
LKTSNGLHQHLPWSFAGRFMEKTIWYSVGVTDHIIHECINFLEGGGGGTNVCWNCVAAAYWICSVRHILLIRFFSIAGKPTTVFFHVTVMSLDSIDESSMVSDQHIFCWTETEKKNKAFFLLTFVRLRETTE